MKKDYSEPTLEVVAQTEADVISTSDILMPPHIIGGSKSNGTTDSL